jgi:hypothetical protein
MPGGWKAGMLGCQEAGNLEGRETLIILSLQTSKPPSFQASKPQSFQVFQLAGH